MLDVHEKLSFKSHVRPNFCARFRLGYREGTRNKESQLHAMTSWQPLVRSTTAPVFAPLAGHSWPDRTELDARPAALSARPPGPLEVVETVRAAGRARCAVLRSALNLNLLRSTLASLRSFELSSTLQKFSSGSPPFCRPPPPPSFTFHHISIFEHAWHYPEDASLFSFRTQNICMHFQHCVECAEVLVAWKACSHFWEVYSVLGLTSLCLRCTSLPACFPGSKTLTRISLGWTTTQGILCCRKRRLPSTGFRNFLHLKACAKRVAGSFAGAEQSWSCPASFATRCRFFLRRDYKNARPGATPRFMLKIKIRTLRRFFHHLPTSSRRLRLLNKIGAEFSATSPRKDLESTKKKRIILQDIREMQVCSRNTTWLRCSKRGRSRCSKLLQYPRTSSLPSEICECLRREACITVQEIPRSKVPPKNSTTRVCIDLHTSGWMSFRKRRKISMDVQKPCMKKISRSTGNLDSS